MKIVSVAVAVLSCVMLTSLLSRAEDKKETGSFLLRVRLSNALTQEIKVGEHDEFDVSTTAGDSQWVVEGTTELVNDAMRVKLNVQWHEKEQAGTKLNTNTTLLLPLDGKERVIGGLTSTTNGVKSESVITVAVQKSLPKS